MKSLATTWKDQCIINVRFTCLISQHSILLCHGNYYYLELNIFVLNSITELLLILWTCEGLTHLGPLHLPCFHLSKCVTPRFSHGQPLLVISLRSNVTFWESFSWLPYNIVLAPPIIPSNHPALLVFTNTCHHLIGLFVHLTLICLLLLE